MNLFVKIILSCIAIYVVVLLILNRIEIKLLKEINKKFTEENEELRKLLSDQSPKTEIPPHIAGKKILHG